jgi:hypothetical protein
MRNVLGRSRLNARSNDLSPHLNGSKRAFDQLESWWLLNLTLGGLGAVEEVVEIDPDLTEQRARVQPNGKPSAGGSILPRASSTQELWGALDYQNL